MKTFKSFVEEDVLVESNKITMSKALYNEFIALEADTVGPGSPKEKEELADALDDAKKKGNRYEIQVSPKVKKYMVNKAIPNMKDIADDRGKRSLVNQLNKLKNNLSEEAPAVNISTVGVTPDQVKDIGPRKKKRHRFPITRRYIEINGKLKKIQR